MELCCRASLHPGHLHQRPDLPQRRCLRAGTGHLRSGILLADGAEVNPTTSGTSSSSRFAWTPYASGKDRPARWVWRLLRPHPRRNLEQNAFADPRSCRPPQSSTRPLTIHRSRFGRSAKSWSQPAHQRVPDIQSRRMLTSISPPATVNSNKRLKLPMSAPFAPHARRTRSEYANADHAFQQRRFAAE